MGYFIYSYFYINNKKKKTMAKEVEREEAVMRAFVNTNDKFLWICQNKEFLPLAVTIQSSCFVL